MAPGKTTINMLGNTRGRPPCRLACTSGKHGARHERQMPASPQFVDGDASNIIVSRRRVVYLYPADNSPALKTGNLSSFSPLGEETL
jgi:hypothetical protein